MFNSTSKRCDLQKFELVTFSEPNSVGCFIFKSPLDFESRLMKSSVTADPKDCFEEASDNGFNYVAL